MKRKEARGWSNSNWTFFVQTCFRKAAFLLTSDGEKSWKSKGTPTESHPPETKSGLINGSLTTHHPPLGWAGFISDWFNWATKKKQPNPYDFPLKSWWFNSGILYFHAFLEKLPIAGQVFIPTNSPKGLPRKNDISRQWKASPSWP